MDIALLYVLAGILLLTWSSDRFIDGAIGIAKYFRVSPLLIGLTVVSLGTSAPEVMVGVMAALDHQANLAVANVIGSNIANIGFVLGLTACIKPIELELSRLKKEMLFLIVLTLTVFFLFQDGFYSRAEGLILAVALFLLVLWFLFQAKRDRALAEQAIEVSDANISWSVVNFLIGTVLLPISAKIVVFGASRIALSWGVSPVLIGLTIVAIGTSLPEAAASVTAALKNEQGIAVGNVLGSNMLNIVAVLPFVGMIAPGKLAPILLHRDVPVMLVFTCVFSLFLYLARDRLSRMHGILLLCGYLAYLLLLIKGAPFS